MKDKNKKTIDYMTKIAILAALSSILYFIPKFPLPFLFPSFLEIQFSNLPAILGGFILGPFAGGLLKIRTTKEFGESTVSKILELVENSSSRKSRSEDFIARFARIYTPAVCYSALALAILPPVIRLAGGMDGQWEQWIYRALTFLVTSCPCALVVSIPLSFFAGIGGASKEGILVKGSNYLETLSRVKCVVFDKTGTLTKGVFQVTAVHHNEMDEAKLLEYAALAECLVLLLRPV